ncbi:MAG: amidohydrolase family protein [Armatimonadetes bacterium]|nr:amidohydrolase family protein [Armatimonadota bacterium]
MPVIDCNTLLGFWPGSAARTLTPEALLESMRARGVGRSLVWHTAAVCYSASVGNSLAVEAARAHPELLPVAVIDPRDYPGCQAEITTRLGEGVRVFRFCPAEHGYPFSAQYAPLAVALGALDEARLVCVHLGLATPLGADIAPLLVRPTVFTLPASRLGEIVALAQQSPAVHVEVSGLLVGGAIEAAVQHLGAPRVLFGSASPLMALGSAITAVQYAEISDADRAALLEGNAARLLG